MLQRPLPLLVAAQALGIWLADRELLAVETALALGAAAIALSPAVRRSPRGRCVLAAVVTLAAGALALSVRLEAAALGRPVSILETTLEGTVASVKTGEGGLRMDLVDVWSVAPPGHTLPERVRIYDRDSPDAAQIPLPGDEVRMRVRLRAPHPRRNPGSHETLRPLERLGIGAVGWPAHPALRTLMLRPDRWRPLLPLQRARRVLSERLRRRSPGGALLAALALGERGALDERSRQRFRRLGLSHLLAVSGLHLVLVAGLVFGGVRWLAARSFALTARWDSRALALSAAWLAATGYALLAGWGIPVRRAWILLTALALSAASGRTGARWQPLAAAALVVLCWQPEALFAPGAQLSFVACAALVAAAPIRDVVGSGWRAVWRRRLSPGLATSASAIAATAPLAAWHFGQGAPFAVVANALAVPWTGLVLLPAALAATLAAALPEVPGSEVVSMWGDAIANGSLSAVDWADRELPGSAASSRRDVRWIAIAAGVAGLALRSRRLLVRVLLACVVGGVVAAAPPRALSPAPPRAIVLDVGQGDATLIQGRSGSVLIDAGRAIPEGPDMGRSVVVPALSALGVRRLDLIVITHADLDHRGGIPAVLEALPVGRIWLPWGARAESGFGEILSAAEALGVPVVECGAESRPVAFGDLRVTPLWPPRAAFDLSRNDRSLVVRVDTVRSRLLFPGDIGRAAEARLVASGADVRADGLLLAHHGSRSSSTAAFLSAVDAAFGVVSAPLSGRFGMPHAEVLARARDARVSIWWTGRVGAVYVALDGPIAVWGSNGNHRPLPVVKSRRIVRGRTPVDLKQILARISEPTEINE